MTYTQNYRLPQWERTDKIQMSDFNRICAVVEEGLTSGGQARRLAENLGRDAYYRAVESQLRYGSAASAAVWANALETMDAAGGEGHGWTGSYGVAMGTGLPTFEGVKATAQEESYLATGPSYVNKRRTAAVTFTSDGYGTMDTVRLWFYQDNARPSQNFEFNIKLTRLDTGKQVQSAPITCELTWMTCQVSLPVESGIRYRMELTLDDDDEFYGQGGFVLASTFVSDNKIPHVTFTARDVAPNIAKTVTPPDGAAGALGLVRWTGTGSVSLSMNGVPLSQTRQRDTINAVGAACRETEFLADTLPTGTGTLTLAMQKGSGSLTVYDYGVIWL